MKTVLLPSDDADKLNETLNNNFKQFNNNLQSYFTNFTQAAGKVKFVDKTTSTYSRFTYRLLWAS